jgi:hypothetical protein
MPPIPGGIPGFYCCVGLAQSKDEGRTFTSLGPVITSQKPKAWEAFPGQADRGAGAPFCAASHDGRYLYAYYEEHSRVDGRGVQICMARSDISAGPPLPGTWRKYYKGAFNEVGLAGLDTPVMDAAPLGSADAGCPFVDYSPCLKKYVMLFNVCAWKEHANPKPVKSGIYVAFSDDGIKWAEPEQVIRDFSIALLNKSVSWHPCVIWDKPEKREGTLVFSHSPRFGHDSTRGIPHSMAGQRVKFEIN